VGVLACAQEESDAALLALIDSCSIHLHAASTYKLIACMLLSVQHSEWMPAAEAKVPIPRNLNSTTLPLNGRTIIFAQDNYVSCCFLIDINVI